MDDHGTSSSTPVRAALPGEAGTELNPDFLAEIDAALDAGDPQHAAARVATLHYADAADLINLLDRDSRAALLDAMRAGFNPEILPELDDAVRDEVLDRFGYADFAAWVAELDSDDAVYLLDMLGEAERAQVLDRLPAELRAVVEQGLAYGEYTAGRLMQRELVAVPSYWTVGETIDYLRASPGLPDDFYVLFVVDPRHRPVGVVRLSLLLRATRATRLADLMAPAQEIIPVAMDQEAVAHLFRRRDLLAAPVVDVSGRLVGRITVDDVVDVIDEEAEDDMLRLGGLSETGLASPVRLIARTRLAWLAVNLGTAILAAAVIGAFEATIEQVVALAVLMPIVASMGGNAGTQTLTAAVRGIAMKDLGRAKAARVIGKEAVVGLINGGVFAVLAAAAAWAVYADPVLSAVIASAMVINMLVAALAGILVPLGLDRLGVDPAVASSVFVTTLTDVVGFFAFLGLAALFLL